MARKRIDRKKDFEKGTVIFTVVESGITLECNIKELDPEMVHKLAVHGLNAKVGDSAADPNVDPLTAMQVAWEQLLRGEWSVRGEGSGAKLEEALAMVTGKDLAEVTRRVASLSAEEKKAFRKNAKVDAAMKQITAAQAKARAEKAANAAEDSDDILKGF